MPIYTFHPYRADGRSDTFVAAELRGDHEAQDFARRLLVQHPSCANVAVWQEERAVAEVHREPASS